MPCVMPPPTSWEILPARFLQTPGPGSSNKGELPGLDLRTIDQPSTGSKNAVLSQKYQCFLPKGLYCPKKLKKLNVLATMGPWAAGPWSVSSSPPIVAKTLSLLSFFRQYNTFGRPRAESFWHSFTVLGSETQAAHCFCRPRTHSFWHFWKYVLIC